MSFKNHMEISPCQLPVILAVYIIPNPKRKKDTSYHFCFLSNIKSVVKIFSTTLYVVILHNNVA